MPAVTAEDFKQRVLAQQAQNAEAEKDTATFCKLCSKHFSTWNSYSNHLQSKKHKEAEMKSKKKLETDVARENAKNREKGLLEDETEEDENKAKEDGATAQSPSAGRRSKPQEAEEDEDEWEDVEEEALPVTRCLFCPQTSETLPDNVDHMTKEHSFFIPNIEFLIDPQSMFEYLGEKVGSGLMCLWCNEKGRTFFTVDAVQRHMRDKGHCKLQCEGDATYEYSDFYDFRSSYPDREDAEEDKDGEVDDGDDSEDEIEIVSLNQDGYELVLPSGARIGHRELMRYYNQNLPPKREVALRNSPLTKKLRHYYRAIGWTGPSGGVYARQAKDMKVIQKFKDKHKLKLQTKANGMQKHFRPQVIF